VAPPVPALPENTYTIDKRILVIDDEPFNLKSMKILLELAIKKLDLPLTSLMNNIDYAKDGNEYIAKVKTAFLERG